MKAAAHESASRVLVLSHYPLTSAFKEECGSGASQIEFLTVTELRQLTVRSALGRLRRQAKSVVVATEETSGTATLPILRALASLVPASSRAELIRGRREQRFSRVAGILGIVRIGVASVASLFAAGVQALRFVWLAAARPIEARLGSGDLITYLNCNLWFGVKAGGSVGHISGVANGFMSEGFQLQFVSVGGHLLVRDSARFTDLRAPSDFALPPDLNYYRFDRACVRQLRRVIPSDAQFIYQRLSVGNITGVVLSRLLGIPLVIEYNGSEVWVAKNWGQRLAFEGLATRAEDVALRHAHLIVTISDVLREELVARGVEPSRIVRYPNCINPDVFDPSKYSGQETQELRRRHGIPAHACVVLFLGTFGQWHGAEVLAQAASRILRSNGSLVRERDVHFVFVGDGGKMPQVRRILEEEPALAGRAHLVGLVPQDRAPSYLAAADVLVAPHVRNPDGTRFFGSPTKLFEYLAMGKAIVASRLEQLGEVLTPALSLSELNEGRANNGAVAVLVEPGDEEELARALAAVIDEPALRATLGRSARELALSKYTWRHHVRAILDGLERVESERR